MRQRRTAAIAIVVLLLAAAALPAHAATESEPVTADEALTVARNWVAMTIQLKGDWGGATAASVVGCQPFQRDARLLGYLCPVEPEGFVVVSLYRMLAPVKAYDERGQLDATYDTGLAELLKGRMVCLLDELEPHLDEGGAPPVASLESALEIDYQGAWEALSQELDSATGGVHAATTASNYQAGEILLSTSWHQRPPYNQQCPWEDCPDWSNGRTRVGCVATAGAQVMNHWSWPPYGEDGFDTWYDWAHIRDRVFTHSLQIEIDAVARLCRDVGIAVDMDYGCEASVAHTVPDLLDAFEDHFRYSDEAEAKHREGDSVGDWAARLALDLDRNRPIPYRVTMTHASGGTSGHAFVADGYRQVTVGSILVLQYHMNYGWDGLVPGPLDDACSDWVAVFNSNAWYVFDALPCSIVDEEALIQEVYPAPSLGTWLWRTYEKPDFPFRYFDQDASGAATFAPGQYLQFLEGVTVTASGGPITFLGSSGDQTRLYTGGSWIAGARVSGGAIKLCDGGSVVLPH